MFGQENNTNDLCRENYSTLLLQPCLFIQKEAIRPDDDFPVGDVHDLSLQFPWFDLPAHAAEGGEVPERSCDHSGDARHRLEEDHAVQIFVMSAATGIERRRRRERSAAVNIGHDSKEKIIFDQLQIACDDDNELEHRRSLPCFGGGGR